MTEYQPYGARHFLRALDPEGAGELRRRPVMLRTGGQVEKGGYADVDEFALDQLLVYRTLVLQHSPSASRPPSAYGLVWSGDYYDVWQRPEPPATRILEHFPLGDDLQPAAVPPCGEVLRLGRLAAVSGGRLATVFRDAVTVVGLDTAARPVSWQSYSGSPGVVYPSGPGTLETTVTVPAAGRYGVWLAGSFRRRLELSVDGKPLAARRHRLTHPGVLTPFGETALSAGAQALTLRYDAASLSPGSGGRPFALGPLVVGPVGPPPPVSYFEPAAARTLCGRSLDWVEAVAP